MSKKIINLSTKVLFEPTKTNMAGNVKIIIAKLIPPIVQTSWGQVNGINLTKIMIDKSGISCFNPNTFVGLVGKVRIKLYPEGEGREGGEKKRAQRARRARGSNPGPAAC